MKTTGGDVEQYIAAVTPERRRRDAETLVTMMREISGREPALWGTIIGFGSCHYRYPTGTEGDMPLLSFAPRKASTTVYVDAVAAHTDDLAKLGPHTSSVSCIYVKDLEKVDLDVLRHILVQSFASVTSGGGEDAAITVTG
ncbi:MULTISPECIES: DUF1801 domain-containing protein [unclassified Microbacterium]|uniref:DUF1801 domain-containing protein n=1 Tax=unclassified Microbacterium TaxID=2609290 RepID=UPI000F552B64|nr:DUF1801 domain-containing protein [Microbacterium sp. ABRD28]AZC12550.1 DUF1801 domain-containing protein [Microbacterium sp. ABRD28]